jgi:Chlamydia polymorphic membrane protein (Chlamydia_PMP) repeat
MKQKTRARTLDSYCHLATALAMRPVQAIILTASLALFAVDNAFSAGVVGNGTAASCTESALNSALSGGGTVTFNCGNVAKTIPITSEKIIAINTAIDGFNLTTLDGGSATRFFQVKPGIGLTLNNLALTNGYSAAQGGAIHSGGYQNTALTINHCSFANNVSGQPGQAGGGAIYSAVGSLTVTNSSFTNNKASMGGAIRILGSNLTVIGSTFTGNKAIDPTLGNGGAIIIDGARGDNGKIIVRNSRFANNSATSYGGALFNNIYNNNTTAITDSLFSSNAVGGGSGNAQGGAIWSNGDPKLKENWLVNANNTTLTIVNTTVSGNFAGKQGGGIWIARHPNGSVISRSTFSGNTADTSMGGGIVQGDNGKLTLMNSTLSGNKAKGPTSMGAGIYVGKAASATITNVTVVDNVANWQAGGIFGGKNVILMNSILAHNIALNGGNNWNIKHNCFEPMTNGGNNIQFPNPIDPTCTADIMIADPKLGALADNGGQTLTRALLNGSPASQKAGACPPTDQRGIMRPNPVGTACDIGAFEAAF